MIKVLFVCLGNICRSPLAEGIFNAQVKAAGLQNSIVSASAGTSGWHIGERPDPRSVEVARKHDMELESYGSKATGQDFNEYDYIIAMDRNNFKDLESFPERTSNGAAKLFLMRDFDISGRGQDVPDPYYGGADGFDHVFELLNRSCAQLLEYIGNEHNMKV